MTEVTENTHTQKKKKKYIYLYIYILYNIYIYIYIYTGVKMIQIFIYRGCSESNLTHTYFILNIKSTSVGQNKVNVGFWEY